MMCVRKQGEFKQRIMKEEKENRIAACKAAKKCGGCQYQGIPYEKQLQDKQKAVRQLMQSFCKTTEIIGMKEQSACRVCTEKGRYHHFRSL